VLVEFGEHAHACKHMEVALANRDNSLHDASLGRSQRPPVPCAIRPHRTPLRAVTKLSCLHEHTTNELTSTIVAATATL